MTDQSLAARITRSPRIYHRERAQDAAALLPDLAPDLRDMVSAAASTAPYLMALLEKEADWLTQAVENPEAALAANRDAAAEFAPDRLSDGLRQGKRRMALLTALADLGGVWSLEEVTGALTDYADAACGAALRVGLAAQIKRGKLPGMTMDDLADCAGMVVFAMVRWARGS